MAWMAQNAAKSAPKCVVHIPSQDNILSTIQTFAQAYGYKHLSEHNGIQVFRKGKGWLTSLTELHLQPNTDGSANLEVLEAVNFLFKMIYFPINAPSFLGKAVRAHKIKRINLLLERLQAAPIQFARTQPKGKIRLKK
ncbi:hypothetical protein ADP71_05740 [Vitreoscilla sp. C1]|nr:hypothetical protein ADP71_05740 [Vitreoscilla sp. C1]